MKKKGITYPFDDIDNGRAGLFQVSWIPVANVHISYVFPGKYLVI